MNERIQKLREQSLTAVPYISLERSLLITEFYSCGNADRVSTPVGRALSFKHLLENKKICINEGELIVGERGPAPKATYTYPEICSHSVKDFEILNSREKVFFRVDAKTITDQAEIINPYWHGRSIRDRILNSVDDEWLKAYQAGIFTEFMEQRAPGHSVLDNKIYKKGLLEFKADINHSISSLDYFNDPEAFKKNEELKAMLIAADALINFAKRYAAKAKKYASDELDTKRKKELEQIAAICTRIPEHAPSTFWEALQYYWFVHLGIISELNTWDSFNPGRLDQHLYPFYKQEIDSGTLTIEKAKELLQCFWIKFNNQPAPPKVGVTAQESNTYTDFCLINLGGLTEEGLDAANDLTYLILEVIEEMRLLQPSSMVQISKKNPDLLVKKAINIIKTGFGQPSLFNSDSIIQELVRQGKSIFDARNGGASGCVESGAFGKESYILTGYFNLVKILELTLYNGIDTLTGTQLGVKSGIAENFVSFDQLYSAFETQLKYFVNIKIKGNLIIERLYADYLPAPFMSIFIDDCIKNGKDYNNGGARYNTSYIQGVGIGSITDCLSSINYNVFDKKRVSMSELINALKNNFTGYEELRNLILEDTPKYGNDNNCADEKLKRVFESYFNAIDGRPNTKGGQYRINLLPTTAHVYFGSVVGAMPDGRLAFEPLSEGISPVQGADSNGPTAVIKSAAKIDHLRTGGTLLNQKFTPHLLQDDDGVSKLLNLIRGYFKMDGHHIQFNVVDADTLKEAQRHPEKYRDLIVRVAGYSDYFIDLSIQLQNEIIKRTEQTIL